ncbi:NADPH-dependent ferric siderophore reductase, contains FAD-binding and SIP domains [Nocardioides scoriae]|uniref:NADPH-dependent ferric siderophore reductase, contains FAD-binding and SIP domains n=1 Tax=Nocardioides scoriae TaxID=642780 RepID=A0A1H1V4X1_9ACTN|nr:siderophore-interacting protein [Nocardioides scoriae]SDS79844.1 NADPH-dependent ferric siderophore reductase, contains FAD-binding and SIP domains [Nocardioides scoriae]
MHAYVLETSRPTPGLVRVVLEGGGLDGFVVPEATDAYVNVALPPAGAPYDAVFDPKAVRDQHPAETWPARRRYTVRAWDAEAQQLTIDFVVHGDEGVAGPWAAAAQPGDVLVFEGPGGGYRPDPAADWHLLVGDESALPAIAASVEVLPAGARAVVRLLCDDADHELALDGAADLDVVWLHRADGESLEAAVAALDWPAGTVHAFVHGEADEIRAIRRHLLTERGVARAQMSCSPYWRRDFTDEAWRRVKRDFVQAMDADA